MKQMDTILRAVGVKTKECRLDEKGRGSFFSPLAKKSQRAAENITREEDAPGGDHRDSSSSPLGETSLPCPDRSHGGDGNKQAGAN